MRAWIVSLLMMSLAFAGCSDGGPAEEDNIDAVDKNEFELKSGKGGIAGLLVNDVFRPIDLEDAGNAAGEFQFEGFVLVQETGERRLTNENGEFTFENLEPGTYKLRFVIQGHEATPISLQVVAGEFSEATVEARRVSLLEGELITEVYSVFVPCVVTVIVAGGSPDCTFDQSGDTNRFAFYPDYSGFGDVTWMVTELLLSARSGLTTGAWGVQIRDPEAIVNDIYYSENSTVEGRYMYLNNENGTVSPYGSRNSEWSTQIGGFQVALFGEGLLQGELNSITGLGTWGAGIQLGQRAEFLVSLFVDEPIVPIETYCILCGIE